MKLTLPGLFDLHVNGFAGIDYNLPDIGGEQLIQSFDAMRATGVTQCLPTIITSSREHFAACARNLVRSSDPMIAGLHMEGPYISPSDGPRGAHPLVSVTAASIEDFKHRQDAAEGKIKLVTLAPEVPGAMDLIGYLVENNVVVGIGHSAANAACIRDAVTAGATLSTHLGNGCSTQMERHANVIWPQLSHDELAACLIVDGFHLPREVVRTMVKAKGLERTILVTDAVAAAAAPPGEYSIGHVPVQLNAARKVTQIGATNLAGSALTLDDAVTRTCAWCDLSLQVVWPLASLRPAAAIGLEPTGTVTIEWDASTYALTICQTET
ncbi:N-acetylglucosamine-6-phosphate deacetylase [Synoicihabitans lomoniglobus]|uniref:Amidohydrolase family protein n=1 Tax=Synoicihabitans lomoniglobus TaxID=2909285 RepID=A0AAF0CRE6_9BACT|nr:amidohydrolase family protein [Opitutaceae bacterium LMO-M01]WED66670.1 amidohydrolase family protein [Opitutaceae bacterium LMO-M01]